MPFGGYAPLPIRLGGDSQYGLTPEQHARICADLLAVKRTQALAVFTFTKVGGTVTISAYNGQNGSGVSFAPTPGVVSTGVVNFSWLSGVFTDPYGVSAAVRARAGRVTCHGSLPRFGTVDITTSSALFQVRTFDDTGTAQDCTATVRIW